MTTDEMNKAAAELDGWTPEEEGSIFGFRCGEIGLIPAYSVDAESTKLLIAKTCTTPKLQAKFVYALHRLVEPLYTKNKAGNHVVSDFDKLTAPTELWLKALLIATGKFTET